MNGNSTEKTHANVDAAEIARFAVMAPIWWDKNGEFKALHAINGLRLDYVDTRAPLAEKRVLDVGCGGGILAEAMAARGAAVTGIDAGQAALAVARLHLKESGLNVNYRSSTAEEFAADFPETFDIVTCFELLEHVPRPPSVIGACRALVKPGGSVFFATLNRNLKSYLFAIIGAEYILKLVRRGTHTYRRFIKPAELQRWAGAAGLAVEDLTGLHYNPFLRRYSLGGNVHVNYLAHFIRR